MQARSKNRLRVQAHPNLTLHHVKNGSPATIRHRVTHSHQIESRLCFPFVKENVMALSHAELETVFAGGERERCKRKA